MKQKLHPEKWLSPFRKLKSAQLAADESLAMAMMFTIQRENTDIAHAVFLVVRKGNKSISRNIVVHADQEGYCGGHGDDVAEYELHETEDLITDTRNQVFAFIGRMMLEEQDVSIDIEKPLFYMAPSVPMTNSEIVREMDADSRPEGNIPKQIIKTVLGLDKEERKTTSTISPLTPEENTSKSTSNLAKAAEEMELIRKFGKKRMESLAKEMGYKGEIINKTKKTHVKN